MENQGLSNVMVVMVNFVLLADADFNIKCPSPSAGSGRSVCCLVAHGACGQG